MATGSADTIDTIQQVTGMAGLAFGAAGLLAPDTLSRAYGLSDVTADYRYVARMWGTRTAVIGALALLAARGDDRRRVLTAGVAMNVLDLGAVLTTRGLPVRTKVMAGLTSATLAGAAAYGISLER